MEITSKFKDREIPSPLNSPTTTSCSNNHASIPITRSDPNSPYPTTFVTADTTSFKQVVQMLTGSSDNPSPRNPTPTTTLRNPKQQSSLDGSRNNFVIPPIKTAPKKQGFKLYERRNSIKNLISPLTANFGSVSNIHQTAFSPRNMPEIMSPSMLDFPSLTLSPVTPLLSDDPFDKSSIGGRSSSASSSEEDKAIAERGFYLHPSPISTPRDTEPQLLPLFPLSSPRVSDP